MNDKTKDERYHVVEKAIRDGFLLVLQEKPLERITVSDIIKRAGIVRSTFYNHYDDIPDLVTAMEDATIQDIFSLMETFRPKNDLEMCRSFFATVCDYTMTNPFLAGLLASPRQDSFFEKMLTMFHRYVMNIVKARSHESSDKEQFSCAIACAIGSTIGLLHKWTVEDFSTPKETVAKVLAQVFLAGMLPFMR